MISKNLILSIVIGAIALIIVCFAIVPSIIKISKISAEMSNTVSEIAMSEKVKEKALESQKLYLDRQDDLRTIDSLFLNADVPKDFVDFLHNLALETDVQARITAASFEKKDPPFISFSIQVDSTFSDFWKFMRKLENSPWLGEIMNVSVGGEGDKVGASFVIKVYVR